MGGGSLEMIKNIEKKMYDAVTTNTATTTTCNYRGKKKSIEKIITM